MRIDPETARETSLDYVQRVNRAIDFILRHLDRPLELDVVAREACFSPFHFHRVFRSMVGETLHQFIKRLRLERALQILSHGPKRTLTDVALACGFGSSSDFSRSFRKRYGVPPSAFDLETFRASRREEWQAAIADPAQRHKLDRLPPGENPDDFKVELRELPSRTVAYLRVLDPYRPDVVAQAADRMLAWADARGLAHGQWLGYMWDDPEIVAHTDCRYDIGLEIASGWLDAHPPEGEIGRIDFPAMLVAQVEVRGPIELEMRALDWLFGTWLPASHCVPTEEPAFEAWIGRPFAHGHEHFEIHVQLPVQKL